MKKLLLPAILFCAATVSAQTSSYSLNIHLKSGESVKYEVADIDRMTFEAGDQEEPDASAVKFSIPQSFADSYVKKVMYGGKQIAEVACEYIKSVDKQMIVVYPCDENGKADLTKGISSTGASVVWDLAKNTATVGEEGDAVSSLYVVDGAMVSAYDGTTADATVVADIITDRRGNEVETYSIVKIGTQYWMAENLRATKFADGSDITKISETESDAWKSDTTGAYLADSEADWVKIAGLLYNGYCVTNEKGIAPEGWEVPTQAQLTALRSAGNLAAVNFKSSIEMTWSSGMTGNNVTGFSAIATGYYSTATGLSSVYSDTYFWSNTKYYDALSRADNLDTLRITGTGKNVVVSSSMLGGHTLNFGHAIRCIRK